MSISTPFISSEEDFLIREIVLTHDPDDRQLDSELLLQLVESTFSSATENVGNAQNDAFDISNIDQAGFEDPISLIIHHISNQILSFCFKDENVHSKTMVLLEKLTHYRWDAKVVLALASLAESFGLFWLILQLQSDNELAASLATVKRLPKAISMLKPKFKALSLLINTMVKVTKVIINFEGLNLQHELLDDKAIDIIKSKICIATYWIFRSILECSSKISDLKNSKLEYLDDTIIASCSLHSLGMKLNSLCHDLEEHMDICHQQIDKRLNEKLLNMFKEAHVDNQKVLRTLFALQHEFPFMINSSQEKISTEELKNEIVILLISKPELLPMDKIFSLVQWTYDHADHKKFEKHYVILWVPISSSCEWSIPDKKIFKFLSNSLPWFSIRRPWSLNATVVNYIKQEWKFKEDPIMVVLNENGMVTNSNAMDMVWIWGPKAFPFSVSRERELLEQENWSLDLMIKGINPLLTEWVEKGKNICICGSENINWIREFTSTVNKIKTSGIQLEVIYVGCNNSGKKLKTIIDTIDQEKLCISLTFTKINFFWFRLERIKKSIGNQEYTACSENFVNEIAELLDFDDKKKSWAVIGRGSSTDVIKLEGEKLKECLELFPLWCKNVAALGLVGAITSAFAPPFAAGTCDHTELVHYEEGLIGTTLFCAMCKRSMEKFVLYKCEQIAQ
ncbi:hypothetical protein ACJIZ3_005208 [Penstemon smallii]|uniref:Protein SIEVE ELEMENT OCCLUSION C n=1 Tax=Penstemon smallii TaxID=265156 RepID=A0ABD3S479_9LAMI